MQSGTERPGFDEARISIESIIGPRCLHPLDAGGDRNPQACRVLDLDPEESPDDILGPFKRLDETLPGDEPGARLLLSDREGLGHDVDDGSVI